MSTLVVHFVSSHGEKETEKIVEEMKERDRKETGIEIEMKGKKQKK